jgi:hypothetical protein
MADVTKNRRATIEELEAAKAFQYKTTSLIMFLDEREGFNPVNDGFHAEIFRYAYLNAVRYNAVMTQHNGKPLGIEFKSKSTEQYVMITPDMSEPGRYRTSYFDQQGFSSHNVYDTIPKAVEEMLRAGYHTPSKGILSQLQQSPEFEIGNRVSTLIGQLNMGKITHQEFSDQTQAVHDDVNNRLRVQATQEPLNASTKLSGGQSMSNSPKITGAAMNMVINDRGETVAAVGNEISIARAKVRWPKLIEETQALFKKYPRDFETQLINLIAAQGIRSTYEAQAVLDASILPLIEKQTIKEPRIVIDPEKYSAMFAPTKFNVGDPVTFTNDYGVVFENKKISGIDKNYGKETRYFMEPNEAHWFSSKESNFTSLTNNLQDIDLDKSMKNNFEDEIQSCQSGKLVTNYIVIVDTRNENREVPFYYCVHALIYAQELAANQTVPGDISVMNIEANHIINSTNINLSPYLIESRYGITEIQEIPSSKQAAIDSFANKGIILVDVPVKDYVWTHAPYLHTEDVKDLEIRIRKDNYMGEIVHSETHKNVKFDDANTLSEKILTEYKQSLSPKFPQLSESEAQELSSFTKNITQHFPEVKPEKLHQLCIIASDMQKLTIQNTNGTLSNEKYNSLTDTQENLIKAITTKDLPGTIASLSYDAATPSIKLWIDGMNPHVTEGKVYPVPEIPKNKLTIAPITAKTATEIVSKKR